MAKPKEDAHWRDIARNPRFFIVDATAVFPLLLVALHIKLWTFYIALVAIAFFIFLERFNFTVPIFFRWLKSNIAGPIRVSKPDWRR